MSQKLYEDMRNRIEAAMNVGQISDEIRKQHKGFAEWDLVSDPRNHQTILQVLVTVFNVLQVYPYIIQYTENILFIIRCGSLETYIMIRATPIRGTKDVTGKRINCSSCVQRVLSY